MNNQLIKLWLAAFGLVVFCGCFKSDTQTYSLAVAAQNKRSWNEAIALYTESLSIGQRSNASPGRAVALLNRAICAKAANNHTMAFEDATAVIGYARLFENSDFFAPENEVSARMVLMSIYEKHGQLKLAKKQLDEALLIQPNHPDATRLLKIVESRISEASDQKKDEKIDYTQRRGHDLGK